MRYNIEWKCVFLNGIGPVMPTWLGSVELPSHHPLWVWPGAAAQPVILWYISEILLKSSLENQLWHFYSRVGKPVGLFWREIHWESCFRSSCGQKWHWLPTPRVVFWASSHPFLTCSCMAIKFRLKFDRMAFVFSLKINTFKYVQFLWILPSSLFLQNHFHRCFKYFIFQ